MKKEISKFSFYSPQFSVSKIDNFKETSDRIDSEMKSKLETYFTETDNHISLENFDYITKQLGNDKLAEVYQMLGPFDYNSWSEAKEDADEEADEDLEEKRIPQEEWMVRKSGAQYRGEVSSENLRPDGKGIKVHQGRSVYEGYFKDGYCHGFGRGISAAGEIYQGGFNEDEMEGKGFFVWPDGKIYEGDWQTNMKHGKGTYYWPNGQIYQGDFKNDQCFGIGILYYPDGKRFEGVWKDGKKHGKGYYVFPNGSMYQVVY